MCYWKGNFGHVIDRLSEKFFVAVVSYTGFDENDTEHYVSVEDELCRIERYIQAHYGGSIRAAYGCSLGGTFVAHLAARRNIHMQYGILGSSDLDQAGSFIVKESIRNQFRSDLTTPLPEAIDNGETETHIFYARKMGKKIPCPLPKAF